MKKITLLLLIVVTASCNNNSKKQTGDLHYFEFDKVEHYHYDISEDEFKTILKNPDGMSRKEMGLMQIIQGKVPVNTLDTLFINNMGILNFQKKELPKTVYPKLLQLFSARDVTVKPAASCMSIYRDVLIFRKKDKVVGVAKIGFNCNSSFIVGTRYNTATFGMSGEFDELNKILSK